MGTMAPGAEKKPLQEVLWHTFAFVSYILCSFLVRIRILVSFGAIMWAGGALVAYVRPNEKSDTIRRMQQASLVYSWGAMGWNWLMGRIAEIPLTEWQRALRIPVPQAFINNVIGYFAMANTIFLFLWPLGFLGYLGQKFFTFRTAKATEVRRKELMRRADEEDADVR